MKKLFITSVSIFLLTVGAMAQNVASGVNDYYAQRFKSAKATFEKLVAANPNDIQATYWLGQAYLGMEDVAGARAVYEKGLATSANAPLLLAGMGQVDLLQNRVNEARQRFESAITASSSKKGNDPEVLDAVGRGIEEVYTDKNKIGDINFAVQKLEEASNSKTKDNALLADIFINLGDAYRDARPGENGGLAFSSYQKATEANPNFALAYYKLARIFNSQHNWELYEKYLTDAIQKDPRFAPAYYDLAYFKMGKGDLAAAGEFADKFAQNSDPDPNNEYLKYSLDYVQKKYDAAIAGAKSIISRLGDKAKANNYKLLAYAYYDKGDSIQAKQNLDQYFAKVKPDEIEVLDYKLKSDIYLKLPGQEDLAVAAIMEGIKADTIVDNQVKLLKDAAETFRKRAAALPAGNDSLKALLRAREGDLMSQVVAIKPNYTINELFDAGRAYYFGQQYAKSRDAFLKFQEKFPNEVYGFEWALNNSRIIDTVKVDSIALPDATKLLAFAEKDTVKYKKQIVSAVSFMATYYANVAKDKDKAIEYLKRLLQVSDPANKEAIQKNIDILSRAGNSQPRSSTKSAAAGNGEKTGG